MPKDDESWKTEEVDGHTVEYRKIADLEEVRIDGRPMQYFRVGDDYQLEANAYAPAQPTLMEAACAFAEALPDAQEE